MRKKFVAGNWKMNTNAADAVKLAVAVARGAGAIAADVAVCPPFVYLQAVAAALKGSRVALGAQDMYCEPQGAFTGEISGAMLKDVGCAYVIAGHSERRHVIGEGDDLINRKTRAALACGLLPILCVGETLEERDGGRMMEVVGRHVREGLKGIGADAAEKVTIAYEPVWAIGTGRNATPQQAQEVHAEIRIMLTALYGQAVAQKMRIQYGGSVKPENAADIMAQPDVDGALVGGASLKADSFLAIAAPK
jgi:triosephosphate isomerase (TIM)